MILTALFSKIAARDPTVMPAWDALRMATIEGAKAIGLGDEIGSLEVDKQADLILVDLKALNLSPVLETPIRNIVPNLVYAASGREVKTVLVAGRILVRDGVVLTADTVKVFRLRARLPTGSTLSLQPPGNPAERDERHAVVWIVPSGGRFGRAPARWTQSQVDWR